MIPDGLFVGSVNFAALTILAMLSSLFFLKTGRLDRENTMIYVLVAGMTGFCLWVFWLCAWMHQWHPLIDPIYHKDH